MSEFRFFAYSDLDFTDSNSSPTFYFPLKPYTKDVSVDEPSTDLNVPYTVFEILVAFFAVIGNLMVIIVFQRERKLRRRTNYYIVSLAIADFLVGLFGVPFAILASVGLPKNLHACLFTASVLVVLCTISIFNLVAVSVDRYWAILYPMAYSRNVRTRTAIAIISMCWVAGTIVGLLPLFGWNAVEGDTIEACLFVEIMDYDYLVFLYFATIITPALLMLAFYAHIYRVIIKQVRQIVTMNPMSDCSRRSSTAQIQVSSRCGTAPHGGTMLRVLGAARKRDVKATQNLSIIVGFFMICWIPLYTINCIKAFKPDFYIHPMLTLFCIILSHLNSAVNPVLYAYHLKDFRAALKNLILRAMGVEIDPQVDAMHRFSIASQHRLHSLDISRNAQPKIYVDSPIWLRQQQQSLKNPSAPAKCGVVQPYLNSINQTAAAVASVTTELEREMWNIVEASSGAEKEEISYEFSDNKTESTPTIPTPPPRKYKKRREGYDSPYSYENRTYTVTPDDVELEEVFLPSIKNEGVDYKELQKSLMTCAMIEKLRSDDGDYHNKVHSSRSRLTDSSYSDYDMSKDNTNPSSPANGQLPQNERANSTSLPSIQANQLNKNSNINNMGNLSTSIYVIEDGTNPLSPGHKPKFKKSRLQMNALTKASRNLSRSCSCSSEANSPTRNRSKEVLNTLPSSSSATSSATNQHSNSNGSLKEIICHRSTTTIQSSNTIQIMTDNNNSHRTNNLNYSSNVSSPALDTRLELPNPQVLHLQQQTFHYKAEEHSHSLPYHSDTDHNSHPKFSPFKTVSHFIFPPIVKHSSLFHLFQGHSSANDTIHTNHKTHITKIVSNSVSSSCLKSLDLETASVGLNSSATTSTNVFEKPLASTASLLTVNHS